MPDLLTTRQVQDLLQIDRTTIYRMVESGQLPAVRVGKQWRFERSALERRLGSAPSPDEVVRPFAPPAQPAAQSAALADLLPLSCCQMIQDAFADALGVTIITTDMEGRPVTQVSNPCGLYSAMLQDVDAVARCIQDWQRVAGAIPLEPRFSPNDLGLLCARGLIRAGNELKGMVFFGGIAPDKWPPDAQVITQMAGNFGVAAETVAEHIDAAFRLDRGQRERALTFVQRIADIFSQVLMDRGI